MYKTEQGKFRAVIRQVEECHAKGQPVLVGTDVYKRQVYDSGSSTDYRMVLYNWFGSKYDGQSYYIKNVNIDS